MEFWGVEVKAGEPLKVKPELNYVIHLSQACLGETKKDKGNDSVLLNLKVGDQKLVLGLLSLEKIPQLSFDLVFEKEFELSHNWKNGSVYFCGYQTLYGEENDFSDLDDSEEEEEEVAPSAVTENGKGGQKVEQAKPATAKSNAAAKPESSEKPKVKVVEPSKDEDDEDSDDDDSDDDEGSDESDDEDMLDADSDDDDEGSDEEDDEETPKKKVESSKKRSNQSAVKTPVSVKKAKTDSAQKSGGKKGAPHTATPHPAKNAGKTPGTADKSKAQTPKSGGLFSCKSCTKSFGSENALQSHSKAKHGGN